MAEKTPALSELKGRRIGRILTKMGCVTRDQVNEALTLQQQKRAPLGQLLIELGYVTHDNVNLALAAQQGMEVVNLDDFDLSEDVIREIPAEMAMAYQILPLSHDKQTNELTVAMKTADNFRALDDLRLLMGFNVKAVVAPAEQLDKLLQTHYGEDEETVLDLISALADDDDFEALADRGESIDLAEQIEMADDNRVKRLLNLVLLQAIKDKASDIHFEPFEYEFNVRYRIDGVLFAMVPPPKHVAMAIASRIKVMAGLDIAERRLPQDGRIELLLEGRPVDLRVSVLPTMFGESCVLRVLDRSQVNLDLDQIGFRQEELSSFRQLIAKPHGIVIVTGPTGSGKTTTLYSALRELNSPEVKILTAEDPVEYDIDGMVQCQVRPEVGLTFARLLRSFLRQDPDVILVGETRDLETAQISVQASLTGHLVFTTLHTNDAPSSIARLLDLGVEPFLLTATLEAVVAQRLVRKICRNCKEEYTPTETQLLELGLTPDDIKGRTFFFGRGCDYCNMTGYKGRTALFEVMPLDDELREMIMNQASTTVLRAEAKKRGMRTLREAGLAVIYEGISTIEEVVKETLSDEA